MLGEGTKTSETKSDKFEVQIKDNLEKFLQSKGKPLSNLKVSRYEGSDTKFYSDIRVTNPENEKNIWLEVKLNKYANLGGPSFKYKEGKWTCTTTKEEEDHLTKIYLEALERGAERFISFCKEYLKTEDINIPKDLSPELIEAWKKSGSVEDTENDVQFITDKVPLEGFGEKIAEYYKTAKYEPVYYIQVDDELYIVDPEYNPLGLKTRDGGELKPLSEAYRIGRIQFRAKGIDKKLKDGDKYYYSIVCDVKILADDEKEDEPEYICSFKSEDKFPSVQEDSETIAESYEPPYTLDQIRQKYGEETFKKLSSDPVHRWRAENGIELIHKEPTKDEFDRIWKNWQLMPDEMKSISDKKSMELFGLDNRQNHEKLMGFYQTLDESKKMFDRCAKVILEDWIPEYDDKPVNQWGERWFKVPNDDAMSKIVDEIAKDCCADPDLDLMPDTIRLASLHRVEGGHYIATVFGGCNGGGDYRKTIVYLSVVKKFAKKLLEKFGNVWLVDWKNDCCDDVWTVRIAFSDKDKEEYADIEEIYDRMFGNDDANSEQNAEEEHKTVGPSEAVDIMSDLTGGEAVHEEVRGFHRHCLKIKDDVYSFVIVRRTWKNMVVYKNDEQDEFFAFDSGLGKAEFLEQAEGFVKKIVENGDKFEGFVKLENVDGTNNVSDVEYRTNIPENEVKEILDQVDSSDNSRYSRQQFEKYLEDGENGPDFVGLFSGKECLAMAVVSHDYPERGYHFIQEIQRFHKGFGEQLIKDIVANNGKTWLGADPTAEKTLVEYYRRPQFNFEEFVVQNSVYGVPLHIFYTKDCDKEMIEQFMTGNYKEIDEAEKEIGGEKSDDIPENGIKIWIDDIRDAPQGFKWFKSVNDFIDWCHEHGTFDDVSLVDTDHDAGDYQSQGGDYIRCFDYLDFCGCKNVTVHIHSANPVGANNIRRIISRNKERGWKEIRNG